MNGSEIRNIRQRLGWSLVEMARQMGCTTDLIGQWESEIQAPDSEACNQLIYLRGRIDSHSERIAQHPQAENKMENERLAQLTHRDLLRDS